MKKCTVKSKIRAKTGIPKGLVKVAMVKCKCGEWLKVAGGGDLVVEASYRLARVEVSPGLGPDAFAADFDARLAAAQVARAEQVKASMEELAERRFEFKGGVYSAPIAPETLKSEVERIVGVAIAARRPWWRRAWDKVRHAWA